MALAAASAGWSALSAVPAMTRPMPRPGALSLACWVSPVPACGQHPNQRPSPLPGRGNRPSQRGAKDHTLQFFTQCGEYPCANWRDEILAPAPTHRGQMPMRQRCSISASTAAAQQIKISGDRRCRSRCRRSNSGCRSVIRWRLQRQDTASVLDGGSDRHPQKANTASEVLQSAR